MDGARFDFENIRYNIALETAKEQQ